MPTVSEIEDYVFSWAVSVTGRPGLIGNEGVQAPEEPYVSVMAVLVDNPDHDIVSTSVDNLSETIRGMYRVDMSLQAIGGGSSNNPYSALSRFVKSMESNERQLSIREFGAGISGVEPIRDISTVSGSVTERRALLMFSVFASEPVTFDIYTAETVSGSIADDTDKTIDFSVPPDEASCG